MTTQLWSTAITSQQPLVKWHMSCWAHLLFIVRRLFSCLAILNPDGVHFQNHFHHWNQHNKTITMVTSLRYFVLHHFLPIFSIPIGSSVCAPLRLLSVFNTFYIAGFIFPSSWWCLRSFLALTWYNFNIASLHLAASICTPRRPSSDYFTFFT